MPAEVPPRVHPRITHLPEPGIERRRLLRAAGINLTVFDFTEMERADRWSMRSARTRGRWTQ